MIGEGLAHFLRRAGQFQLGFHAHDDLARLRGDELHLDVVVQQDLEQAKQAYEQVLEQSPDNVAALHGLLQLDRDAITPDVIRTVEILEERLAHIKTPMSLSIIGCVVNGPGEAREADVGLTGASPNNLIYVSGQPDHKVSNQDFIDHLEQVIRQNFSWANAKPKEICLMKAGIRPERSVIYFVRTGLTKH